MTLLCHAVGLRGISVSLVCTLMVAKSEVDFLTRMAGDTVRWRGWPVMATVSSCVVQEPRRCTYCLELTRGVLAELSPFQAIGSASPELSRHGTYPL